MKQERLRELVDNLVKGIINGTEESFNYELCPYFDDCSRKVMKVCLFDYENYLHYKHRKEIVERGLK